MSSLSDWFKVENALPSEGKEVIVYRERYNSNNDEIQRLIQTDMIKNGEWFLGPVVTHWTYLPEPPK
jgi:hypothetical protein